jgi:immune inhibitor A
MRRSSAGVLLAALAIAACSLPFDERPPPEATATTTARLAATAGLPATTADTPPSPSAAPAAQQTAAQPNAAQPTPIPATASDELARIAAAEPLARDQLALAEALKGIDDPPAVARTTPLDVKVGDVEQFWVSDQGTNTNYQIEARLRYAGPVVLMYLDTTIEADQAAIEQSARQFEQEIYPRNRQLFGAESSPGIDGDPRLTIVNTALRGGVAGYFVGSDGVVEAVNRFSNQRDMFLMSVNSYSFGTPAYASTLAHEFQHMIEWNQARRSPAWFNEGMSMLAEDLNGFILQGFPEQYLKVPDLQLNTWEPLAIPHYGASQLFLRYFQEQYAGESGMAELIRVDAGNQLEAFVPIAARKRQDITSFADIYADWAVANALNDPLVGDGRYAYKLLPAPAAIAATRASEIQTTVHQFGVDYYDLRGPLTLTFDGADRVGVTSTQPRDGQAMWWSNRGDDSVETLTRALDLSGVRAATLQFATWYELELDYDYAFVSVSADGGATWQPLKASSSTDQDPQGHNYGHGITGVSGAPGVEPEQGTRGQWVDEQIDLTAYAGKSILLRFWVVNDDAVNSPGMLIDNIRIPELSYADSAEQGDAGWQAQGFVRTSGELPQTWALRLIRVAGGATTVERVPVDAQGRATVTLDEGQRGTLAVIGTTEFTTEPAGYTYAITQP